jgi:hypothetical protein
MDRVAWPSPPRMPLGVPHRGTCDAAAVEPDDTVLRRWCNFGYARGECPHYPAGGTVDAVRFTPDGAGLVYILETGGMPAQHGRIHDSGGAGTLLDVQASAYLAALASRRASSQYD